MHRPRRRFLGSLAPTYPKYASARSPCEITAGHGTSRPSRRCPRPGRTPGHAADPGGRLSGLVTEASSSPRTLGWGTRAWFPVDHGRVPLAVRGCRASLSTARRRRQLPPSPAAAPDPRRRSPEQEGRLEQGRGHVHHREEPRQGHGYGHGHGHGQGHGRGRGQGSGGGTVQGHGRGPEPEGRGGRGPAHPPRSPSPLPLCSPAPSHLPDRAPPRSRRGAGRTRAAGTMVVAR